MYSHFLSERKIATASEPRPDLLLCKLLQRKFSWLMSPSALFFLLVFQVTVPVFHVVKSNRLLCVYHNYAGPFI